MPLIKKKKKTIGDDNPLRMLTLDEVAARLNVTRQTIYRWVRQGRCPFPVLRMGRIIRVRQDKLQAFLDSESTLPEDFTE